MKILVLVPEMIFPANTGGRIVSCKRIQHLSTNNDVYLFGICDSDDEKIIGETHLRKYCKYVHFENRNKSKLHSFLDLWKAPYACVSRWNVHLKKSIIEFYNRINPDYVMVEFPQMLGCIGEQILNSGKVILGLHNIEYKTMRNLSNSIHGNFFKKVVFYFESFRFEKYEELMYNKYKIKLFTFVSSEDKAFFEEKYHLRNTYLLPIGTDIIKEPDLESECLHNISFFGKMNYLPNIEAIVWFVEKVLPVVKQKVPDVKLYVVGKDPDAKVKNLGAKNSHIIVTGTVDSVEPFYDKTNIVIIPLAHGGGVKVKLLEALGHQKLIISTLKGLEGTDFISDKHLLAAYNSEDFSDYCINALENIHQYDKIIKGGYEYVAANYSWNSIVRKFEKFIEGLS